MLIEWSDPAYDDLAEILSYFLKIGQEELGQEIVYDIVNITERLIDFSLSGRVGRIIGTRELINNDYPYIVVYEILSDLVRVIRVIHMSKSFPETL